MIRPKFDHLASYVAVRSFYHDGVLMEPGDKVEARSSLMRMFLRSKKIGPVGHDWTKARLEAAGVFAPKPAPVEVDEDFEETAPEPTKVGSQWSIEGTDRKFSSKAKAKEWYDGQRSS